jgi:mono/diheme cytochrome c family protein
MSQYRIGLAVACCLAAAGALTGAQAAPADTAQVKFTKECGACHMAFQPELLPARSWTALMAGLNNHFGENATLDADTNREILAYLQAHAADAGGGWHHHHNHMLRGLSANDTPLRITDTPYWIREHRREIAASAFSNPKVKSKANCVACHAGAEKGYYDDDD